MAEIWNFSRFQYTISLLIYHLSLANTMMGPSVLLLPLKFFDVGIGMSASKFIYFKLSVSREWQEHIVPDFSLQFLPNFPLFAIVLILVIGLISYRTCDLCHLHTKLTEFEYLTAIERILGKFIKICMFWGYCVYCCFE